MAKDTESGMIDLGREYDSYPCCESKDSSKDKKTRISYPSLYINGVKGLDIGTGEITFTAKGKVVSVSQRDDDGDGDAYSCEIEVHAIKIPGAEAEVSDYDEDNEPDVRLSKAIDKIHSDKEEEDDSEM